MSRRHPALAEKAAIWKLIADSYAGGHRFVAQENYLFRYPREGTIEYNARKKRTSYFNYVQPVADILIGLLYTDPVSREIPKSLDYLVQNACEGATFDQFMQRVGIQSLLSTCGILVDSPRFDPGEVQTVADRREKQLNPYCVLYSHDCICDFDVDTNGRLRWLILDNSTSTAEEPGQPRARTRRRRLWTTTYFQDFEMLEENKTVTAGVQVEHNLGEIPFVFVNWKNVDFDSMVGETPFEDIALLARAIYNYNSLLDENMHAGTFKSLFYPVTGSGGVPPSLKEKGIGNLTTIPFDGALSQKPYFDGPELGDIDKIILVMDRFEKAILSKVGLDKDSEKAYAQSGVAKSLEYRKAHAILTLGAESLEKVEKDIFRLASLWEGADASEKVVVHYRKKFDPDAIATRVAELYALFNSLPYKSVKAYAAREILKLSFPEAEQKDLKDLLAAIDSEPPETTDGLVDEVIKAAGTTPKGDKTTA